MTSREMLGVLSGAVFSKTARGIGLLEGLRRRLGSDLVRTDVSMANLCTYRVGGPARLAVFPATTEQLSSVVRFFAEQDVPFDILGMGSNVLVSDAGINGPVVVTSNMDRIVIHDRRLRAQAGASCTDVVQAALEHGLAGIEFFHKLPGSVGGAAFMNARAFGQEFRDRAVRAIVVDERGQTHSMDLSPDLFAYKRSPFMERGLIVAEVEWVLEEAPPDRIQAQMEANGRHRSQNGEDEYPSCGCVFKNPSGESAGRLVDACGLKGLRIGGAWVSERHGNFVVHDGQACAGDIRAVMETVRRVVAEKAGVVLDYEVRFLGQWPHRDD
ncbi:MAG: UDP-N-acetylmuramate dehydrogenase [Deltaproteobacteria bacterium]|nr:UDP-N-acetylmuramate dehydrogenase [Deltaproteobacteria bacterium]